MDHAEDFSCLLSQDERVFSETRIALLDRAVSLVLEGKALANVHGVLADFKALPTSWKYMGTVLQSPQVTLSTKFFALQVLQDAIQTKWNLMSDEDKQAIPVFVFNFTNSCAKSKSTIEERSLLQKANGVVVDLATKEWPKRWQTFVSDICRSAVQEDAATCENNMQILNLLSEQVFDYGRQKMTSRKCQLLTNTLTTEFRAIYNLCGKVVDQYSKDPNSLPSSMIFVTLDCIGNFLKWVPVDYIFESNFALALLKLFWEPTLYRTRCVKCLTEIFFLTDIENNPEAMAQLAELWLYFLMNCIAGLPKFTLEYGNPAKVPPNSSQFWEELYAQLAFCIATFVTNHGKLVGAGTSPSVKGVYANAGVNNPLQLLMYALNFQLQLTTLEHEETFKTCIEFWHDFLLQEIYKGNTKEASPGSRMSPNKIADSILRDSQMIANSDEIGLTSEPSFVVLLDELRALVVDRMAKPPEVFVTYDEEAGTLERDKEVDTQEVALYKLMRETLIQLAKLDGGKTAGLMLKLLSDSVAAMQRDLSQARWSPKRLNQLCWAIGAISGVLDERSEKVFIMDVFKYLMQLCEVKRGRDAKSVVATMLMYVVGEYPRFLIAYPAFLDVVIEKLLVFMATNSRGVQDMACSTLFRISRQCPQSFVACPQREGSISTLEKLLNAAPELSEKHLHFLKQRMFLYHSISFVVATLPPSDERKRLMDKLMMPLLTELQACIVQSTAASAGALDPCILCSEWVINKVTEVIKRFERICDSAPLLSAPYFIQMYQRILDIYSVCDAFVISELTQHGLRNLPHMYIKQVRAAKKAILRLFDTFIARAVKASQDAATKNEIVSLVIPPLYPTVLDGFKSTPFPDCREDEVIILVISLVHNIREAVTPELTRLFDACVVPAVNMIKADCSSHPDIRAQLFSLLLELIQSCFEGIVGLDDSRLEMTVDTMLWAAKHEDISSQEKGLKSLLMFLVKLDLYSQSEKLINKYAVSIVEGMLDLLTDRMHASGFSRQVHILRVIFQWIEAGKVQHRDEALNRIGNKISMGFPNLSSTQILTILLNLLAHSITSEEKFAEDIKDLLVLIREWAGELEFEQQEALKEADAERAKAHAEMKDHSSFSVATLRALEASDDENEEGY